LELKLTSKYVDMKINTIVTARELYLF